MAAELLKAVEYTVHQASQVTEFVQTTREKEN